MNVIDELMVRIGIEQKELAAAIGVSQPTVSDWKRKKKDPKGENLEKVAMFFGVSPMVIKGLDPIPSRLQSPPDDMTDDEREMWELREAARRDPDRRMLMKLAKNGTAQDVKQAAALIDALRKTNPDFYDGDDPA